MDNYSLYGLPEDVHFCKKCVISNQRPRSVVEFKNSSDQKKSGIDFKDFFQFIEKYKIREITKNGLIEPNFDELIKNPLAVNLFLF